MKKFFLILISILLLMTALAGCGKGETAETAPPVEEVSQETSEEVLPVTVISGGTETVPEMFCYEEYCYGEDGWYQASGSAVAEDLYNAAPEVMYAEDFDVRFAENVGLKWIDITDEATGEMKQVSAVWELYSFLDNHSAGRYYIDIHITQYGEKHGAEKEYRRYSCGFKLVFSETDTLVKITSNGEEIVPKDFWFCGMEWVEGENPDEGMWLNSDGEYLCDILDEVCDELPVVIFEEDFSLQYAPDADFKLVNVYNEAFKKIMDSDNVDILRDLPTGEYYADLVVFKNGTEIHDGETGYDGYACGFKFVVPDVYEPIIEVYANGESVAAAEYWFCSRKWAENNWMYSDGMRLANRMKEVYKEFPEVQMEEDLFLQPGENTGQLKIRVYDDNLKFIGETTHPEVLKALSHGTYYLTIEVFRFGTDLHSDEVDYEGYECGLKLVVPKGSDSSATKRGVPLVSAVTKQGEIPLFKHNGTGIVWIGETPHEVYEDPIIGSPRTLERVWLLENMITSGNKAKLPTISETELIELKLADGIVFSHAAFFDEFGIKYAEYEESEHVLQNIRLSSELPKGRNYLMNVVVMEYGFELAEDERDCNIYEYACTLSIPE